MQALSRVPHRSFGLHTALIVLAAAFGVSAVGTGSTVLAAPSPPKDSPPPVREAPSPTSAPAAQEDPEKKARAEAEALYAKGYTQVEEAKKEKASGKPDDVKNAKKKFKKALGSFQEAVARSPEYFEAWNMIGYCSRNTGDLKKAFAAYEKALSINPNYDEAHEYLGEAYIMSGDLAKAKTELAWLKARDSDEAEELEEKIEAAEEAAGKSEVKTGEAKPADTEKSAETKKEEPAKAQESAGESAGEAK
jgi:tetratricopeptide (TPR) repeat protein